MGPLLNVVRRTAHTPLLALAHTPGELLLSPDSARPGARPPTLPFASPALAPPVLLVRTERQFRIVLRVDAFQLVTRFPERTIGGLLDRVDGQEPTPRHRPTEDVRVLAIPTGVVVLVVRHVPAGG